MTDGSMRHLHHVGITVRDMARSVQFWSELTGGSVTEPRVTEAPHVADLVGYPGLRLEVANVSIEGLVIELLQYRSEAAEPYDEGTAHPGNVHLCFDVADMDAAFAHAVRCGAVPVGGSPVVIPEGAQAGGRLAYLRSVDGASVELPFAPTVIRGPQTGVARPIHRAAPPRRQEQT